MHWYWSRVSSEVEHPTKSTSQNSFVPDDAFFQFCEYFINFFNLLKQQHYAFIMNFFYSFGKQAESNEIGKSKHQF